MAIFVTNTSFVFIVEVSDPSRFNSNYLAKQGVLPSDSQPSTNVTLPFVSQIRYMSGLAFDAAEQRVVISQDISVPTNRLAEPSDVEELTLSNSLRDAALKLVPTLATLRLQSVGVNFRLFDTSANLAAFAKDLPSTLTPTSMQLTGSSTGVRINYTMTVVAPSEPAAPTGVMIDANFDGQVSGGALGSDETRAVEIEHFVKRQSEFFELLKGTLHDLDIQ